MGYESEENKAALDPNSKQARLEEILRQQELESDRALYQAEQEREDYEREKQLQKSEPWKMGVGSYVLILFALFVDIIEIITVYTGVGAVIAIPLGLIVDVAIFLGIGLSRKARKQWKRFAVGFVAENFPVLASVLEFIPFRTLALIWMYRGMSQPENPEESKEKENEQ